MMKLFRKSAMKKWGMFIASIMMLCFMLWGGQTYLLGDRQSKYAYAGKIFGRKVSFEEFQKTLTQVETLARLQYGENFRKIQEMLNLDGQTWDRILLLHEARRRRINVPDADVIAAVENITRITIDSPLVRQNYENFLRRELGVFPRNFEEGVRDSLKIAQVFAQETTAITISDPDVEQAYRQKNEKAQVSYAIFAIDEIKKQIPFDETKAQEYFASHKDEFLMPPTVEVEFIQIDAPKLPEEKPEKDDAKKDEITHTSSEDATDAAWQKAEDLYEEILNGKDFAQVAKENNLAIQISDPFTMEQPVLKSGWTFPLVQKIFQTKVGDVLEPIGTPDGFQILKVKSKKDTYVPEYADVKDKVRDQWLTLEAQTLSQKKAEEARTALLAEFEKFKNPDFVQIAKGMNLTLAQTQVFGRGEYLPTIGISRDFQDAAFTLTVENPVSAVVETPKGYAFLHLDNVVAADMKDFEKEKETFGETLLAEKKSAVFSDFLNRLRIQANLEDNIAKMKAQQKQTR